QAVQVWDATSGKPVSPPLKHPAYASNAALSPDGRRLAVAVGNNVHVWNVATGEPTGPVIRVGTSVWRISFSPDGSRVLTATQPYGTTNTPRGARVWDAATGKAVTPLLKQSERGAQVAVFSPDGRRVLTAGEDGTARVWRAATGEPLTPPLRHTGRVESGWFAADGHRVFTHAATAGATEARLWDFVPETRPAADLLAEAHLLASQQLDATGTLV